MGYDLNLKAELKATFISSNEDLSGKEIEVTDYFDLWNIGNEKDVLEIIGDNITVKGYIVSCNHKETYERYRRYIKKLEYINKTEKQHHLKELKEFFEKYSNKGYEVIWYAC